MQEQEPRLKLSIDGQVTIIELMDRKMLDEVNILQIGRQLNDLVAQSDKPKFVVDFSNVVHLSSSALGILITLGRQIREKDGQLRLCGIQPAIHEIFLITRLSEVLHICSTRGEAIESMA